MDFDSLAAEQEAAQSFVELVAQAKRCQQLYERANMTLPESVKRFFSLHTNGKKLVASVPPPERPPLPSEAEANWVSIRIEDAYPQNVALALLRSAGGTLAVKDLIEEFEARLENVNRGTVYNVGPRLDTAGIITRSDGVWELIKPENAPILHENLIWAPASVFNKQELAAHRRDAIIHVLRTFRAGLQTSQIIEVLQNCPWVHAPVNKELVQDDVQILSKAPAKIKRRGNTKKWGLVEDI
jgi:hypothetical protein